MICSFQAVALLCAALLSGCVFYPINAAASSQPAHGNTPEPPAAALPTRPAPLPTATGVSAEHAAAPTQAETAAAPRFDCSASPRTAALLAEMQPEPWMDWVRRLSGDLPVMVGGQQVRITSRYTPAMFGAGGDPLPYARAFEYVEETVLGWYPRSQVTVQPFSAPSRSGEPLRGKNLILTLPGERSPDEVVILSAHLDSRAADPSEEYAPGADDNASGAATLLEAARLLREARFERTLRLIWFTGEEQGLVGSQAYVATLDDPRQVVGVVNLDMFGYDSDGDRCFEIHAGALPASQQVAQCFIQSAAEYQQGLEIFDLLTDKAIDRSDHGSFWKAGVGAVEILENMFDDDLPSGCPNGDRNPNYHTAGDTAGTLNPDTAIRIARTALATTIAMAVPLEAETSAPAPGRTGLARFIASPPTTGAEGNEEAQPWGSSPLVTAGWNSPSPLVGEGWGASEWTSAVCAYNPEIDSLLEQVTLESYTGWVRGLSGADPVIVGGASTTITTRYSTRLFDGSSPAYDYLREQIISWYSADWIEEDPFLYSGATWKNLVLTIPGSATPETVVMLTAHFDSTTTSGNTNFAPGADDNATGAAALFEAARVLQDSDSSGSPFASTLRLVWFTGEEQGLVGSRAYAGDHDLSRVLGVINVDMVGYDADGDRCFEMHVGTLPASDRVGSCLAESIEAYDLDLSFDYLTTTATTRSDHSSFWYQQVGAVELLENYFDNSLAGGCTGRDVNPYYHSGGDTIANMHPTYAFDISRAAVAAAFALANQPAYQNYVPAILRAEVE